MMKYFANILPIIVLLFLGVIIYSYYKHTPAIKSTSLTEVQQPQKLTLDTDAFHIDITYPTIPGSGKQIDDANATLRAQIDNAVSSFKKDSSQTSIPTSDLPASVKSTAVGSPSIEEQNDRYVAVYMGGEWYMRGAAHPYHTIDTYIYDYQEGKLISIPSGLFIAGSNYLDVLSKLSQEDLFAQSNKGDEGYVYDKQMVEDGTKPTADNFSRILPSKDGLIIYFDEYQVAPYAAGPQQVVIPYAKLKSVIDPNGVLGMYIQ